MAKDPKPEPDPLLSFVTGHYTLAGRQPDDGAAYAGEAVIEAKGHGLLLRRTVAGKTLVIEGKIEVPQPPGEGQVLRFAYSEGGEERTLTCLVSGDLDNYARLSCVSRRAPSQKSLKPPPTQSRIVRINRRGGSTTGIKSMLRGRSAKERPTTLSCTKGRSCGDAASTTIAGSRISSRSVGAKFRPNWTRRRTNAPQCHRLANGWRSIPSTRPK